MDVIIGVLNKTVFLFIFHFFSFSYLKIIRMRGVKFFIILASNYFSIGPPLQYWQHSGVSPLSSGWIGVVSLRLGHQNILP